MENPTNNDSYAEAKRKAKEFYKTIGHVFCPALDDGIAFNSIGFRHLMQKQGNFRIKEEQVKRFSLLLLAKEILENPKADVKHEKRKIIYRTDWRGKKVIKKSFVDYWIFTARWDNKIIRLVARRFGSGKKHFLTIYEKIPHKRDLFACPPSA